MGVWNLACLDPVDIRFLSASVMVTISLAYLDPGAAENFGCQCAACARAIG